MGYKTVYRCRLCKKSFCVSSAGSENIALGLIKTLCSTKMTPCLNAPEIHEPHKCEDGSIGIADFYGFIKDKEEDKNNG